MNIRNAGAQEKDENFEIVFDGKKYFLNKEKLLFILNYLGANVDIAQSYKISDIKKYMKKFFLYDEAFLETLADMS